MAATRAAARRALITAALALGCDGTAGRLSRIAAQGDVAGALRLYRAHTGGRANADTDALAGIALALLRHAASAAELRERNAGFAAIRSMGLRTRETLEELRRTPGVTGERAASLLYDLAGRSGSPPRELEAAALSDDPERRVAGLAALEGRGDVAGLVSALAAPAPEVRRAAAQRLARLARFESATRALLEHAAHDPDGAVRSSCVSALGSHGAVAAGAIESALEDPDTGVRMAAPTALIAAAPADAARSLHALLIDPPNPLALEAARALASRGDGPAIEYLLRALDDPRAEVRAQAAVGAYTLVEHHHEALSPHLEDADVEVQLRVAGVLARRPQYRARLVRALRPVSRRPDPFVAVRALGVLIDAEDNTAAEPLRGALGSSDATIRRLALVAWSRHVLAAESREVAPLAPLLEDPDLSVRLMAAAEIVRITSVE